MISKKQFKKLKLISLHKKNKINFDNITLSIPDEYFQKTISNNNLDFPVIEFNNNKYNLNINNLNKKDRSDLIEILKESKIFTKAPLSSKLFFGYQLIPKILRVFIAKIIGKSYLKKKNLWAEFPDFPIDLSTDIFNDLFFDRDIKNKKTAVVLTHDIDNEDSFNNLEKFLKIEEKNNIRSTNFIVPFKWKLDIDQIANIKNRGHEIGIHGFDHNNKTPFLNEKKIIQRMEMCRELIDKFDITGYRAPSLLRTEKLLKILSSYFKYDSSIPTSGGLFPVPNNGCATSRIFKIKNILEIPVSLPRDGSLLFLGYKPKEILKIWIDCAEIISKFSGVIVSLTHPDKYFSGNKNMFSVYCDFISYLKTQKNFEIMTCLQLIKNVKIGV